MNNWFWYENSGLKEFKSLEDFPENCFGFIYKVTNETNDKFYIGKKNLYHNNKKKLTKKELAEQTGPGRKSTTKIVQKESDWLNYWGSNKELQNDIKELGVLNFEREILKLCFTKKELTYWELSLQCQYEVLLMDSYNDNILGKFFKKDFAPPVSLHIL